MFSALVMSSIEEKKIFGIGVDVENISRFEKYAPQKNSSFFNKLYTKNELDYCFSKENPHMHLAARFAGKEAVIKAMSGMIEKNLKYSDIEILNDEKGAPTVNINGEGLDKFQILDKPVDWKSLSKRLYQDQVDLKKLANEINIGEPTLEDILTNLEKPGRDPREELPKPMLKSDVLKLEDLHEGMILKGTVRNVVDFGAFIDIGIKRDGLVHVSEMGEKYVKDPHKIVSVGDIISVKVIGIDIEKGRVKLSLKI